MVAVTRVLLDVLKPHEPNALEFSSAIASAGEGYQVRLQVVAVDKYTESLVIEIVADAIDMDAVHKAIESMGGSLHSVDEVEVENPPSGA